MPEPEFQSLEDFLFRLLNGVLQRLAATTEYIGSRVAKLLGESEE